MSTKKDVSKVSSQSVLRKSTTNRKRDDSVERKKKDNVVSKVGKDVKKDVKGSKDLSARKPVIKKTTTEVKAKDLSVRKVASDVRAKDLSSRKVSTEVKPKDLSVRKVASEAKPKDLTVRKPVNSKSLSRMGVPSTPPSNRVTKSQFFPSKSMYSKALKSNEPITTKETLIKPIVVNKSKPKPHQDESSESTVSERPRTATLRKGSIVNANIVGPEAPKLKKHHREVKPPSPESENYEDDFESYDSDFEAYSSSSSASNLSNVSSGSESSTSISDNTETIPKELTSATKRANSANKTEEERKLDSGIYLPEQKHKQLLDNIKESIEKENATLGATVNPASLSDEGFEESKSLQFINFADAQEKFIRRKSAQLRKKRGDQLMSMIRLNKYDFTLFKLEPVPYEKFIQKYGKTNSVQTSSQTGDDNVNEESQTDSIESQNKWTQFPITLTKFKENKENFWDEYKSELLGVGCDITEKTINEKPAYDNYKLKNFILTTGKLILRLQEESIKNIPDMEKNKTDIPFSAGTIHLDTKTDIFKECSITCANFATNHSNIFLAVHSKTTKNFEDFKSVISIWNIFYSQEPRNILTSFNDITSCTFEFGSMELIIGGTNDGSILMWNLGHHLQKEGEAINCPNFSTDINVAHSSKVVAIESLTNYLDSNINFDKSLRQICSLDEDGEIILWNIVTKTKNEALIKNMHISLTKIYPDLIDLKCTDLIMDKRTINNIYIATNYGNIIKYQFNDGGSNHKETLCDLLTEANCLEPCPFSPNYYLAGYQSGNINLFSSSTKKPLNILSNNDADLTRQSVQALQWSRNKPFIIYAKDESNSIHIWDLAQSDLFPIYSIPFGKNITCMKLSPMNNHNAKSSMDKSFMILGTFEGEIILHVLSDEYAIESKEKYEENIRTFLNYVNRL